MRSDNGRFGIDGYQHDCFCSYHQRDRLKRKSAVVVAPSAAGDDGAVLHHADVRRDANTHLYVDADAVVGACGSVLAAWAFVHVGVMDVHLDMHLDVHAYGDDDFDDFDDLQQPMSRI